MSARRLKVQEHPAVVDFLGLTKYTCPHGFEEAYYGDYLRNLGALPDAHGNYWLSVGDSATLFAAHLDTADGGRPKRVRHKYMKGHLLGTMGDTILGADDRAGVAVLLYLIRKGVPGTYAFFVGEEVGRVGSEAAVLMAEKHAYQRVIQWDRRGYDSIITEQMGEVTASTEFAYQLADAYRALGVSLMPDDGGSFTDTYSYRGVVGECTNISIGYEHAHTSAEVQDLAFLARMASASVEVDWEGLKSVREPVIEVYPRYSYRTLRGKYGSSSYNGSYEGYGYASADDDVTYWRKQGAQGTLPWGTDEVSREKAENVYLRAKHGATISRAELDELAWSDPDAAVLLIGMLISREVGD